MADFTLKLNVNLNLRQLLNVDRYQKQNQPTLVKTAAYRYLRYLRNRFISLASGGGSWPVLKETTIERKERRGVADNPEWILREYNLMLHSLGVKLVGKITYVGYVNDRRHHRGKMISELVRIHATGADDLPIRQSIGLPNRQTRLKMVQDIRAEYNKIIRKNRSVR